ncbi:MAG TPA: ABC transporter ATP-binding protein [Anaerolineales bacterium]
MSKKMNLQSEALRLVKVTKRFGNLVAVKSLDLSAEPGKITTLLGPSGCGKTTTLRLVAGFYIPDEGEIFIGDERITDLPPYKRPTRTVFQNYALFPHMSVYQNVVFGLELQKVPRSEREDRVNEALEMVGLSGLGNRQPGQLSGGQQQRVALARALVTQPKLLLLDEPLSNLDAKLRVTMREEIRRLQRSLGITVVYVTHDQEEALSLSDTIAVMDRGEILQIGSPAEVYELPATRFVAKFLGLSNFFRGEVVAVNNGGAVVKFGDYAARARVTSEAQVGSAVMVSVRPESLMISRNAAEGMPAQVISSSYLGSVARYHLRIQGQEGEIIVDEHAPVGSRIFQSGDETWISILPERGVILR